MLEQLEFWHIAAVVLSILVGIVARWVASFSRTLESFQAAMTTELRSLKDELRGELGVLKHDLNKQVSGLEHKFERHEDRMRYMTLHMERRVTRIETQIEVSPYPPLSIGSQDMGREL